MMLTVRITGEQLLTDSISRELSDTVRLSVSLGESRSQDTPEVFTQKFLRAARSEGGRLLLLDTDGKIQADTYGTQYGMLLPLSEAWSILRGEKDSDYGLHLTDGNGEVQEASVLDRFTGRDITKVWQGCFASAFHDEYGRLCGVLILEAPIQDRVNAVIRIRDRILCIFAVFLFIAFLFIILISTMITRPVAALTEGIGHMAKGEFDYRVRVRGHDELAQLASAFNQMSEQVHSLDEARNQFVSNASHELKTPLTTIKILVQSMLYEDDTPAELRREFLGDIDREIDRLSSVVGDLLTLVHIDSGKMQLKREMILLADTVRETEKRLQPLAGKREQMLTVRIEDDCSMFADAGKLSQVCYNLIENALKYTPDGGSIDVLLRKDGRDAVLEVKDNGVGIPEDNLPHIFDRFYRVDKARSRETGGTGLGLSIVQQIVRLHGGTISVASEYGKGSTFTVVLPLSR